MVIIPVGIYYYNQQKAAVENTGSNGIASGPFSINKEKYRLGDYVFMVVEGLQPSDGGKMIIYDPKGGTFSTVQFNGTLKTEWNYAFKPDTVATEKLCTPQDLLGNWTIVFNGTSYKPIVFQVINEWVEGAQSDIKAIPHGIGPC